MKPFEPIPWGYCEIDDDRYNLYLIDEEKQCCGYVGSVEFEEDAKYIVEAVNSYGTLQKQNERMREVLKWYAKKEHYYGKEQSVPTAYMDAGHRARAALEDVN